MKLGVIILVVAGLIGLFTFGSYLYGIIAKRRSIEELPEVGRRLGLEVASDLDLRGTFRGRRVEVRPRSASFFVELRESPALILSTLPSAAPANPELPVLETRDSAFDRTFGARFADAAVAQRLREDAELRAILVALARSSEPPLRFLALSPETGLVGASKAGGLWEDVLPADTLESLLGRLVEAAEAVETRLR